MENASLKMAPFEWNLSFNKLISAAGSIVLQKRRVIYVAA